MVCINHISIKEGKTENERERRVQRRNLTCLSGKELHWQICRNNRYERVMNKQSDW